MKKTTENKKNYPTPIADDTLNQLFEEYQKTKNRIIRDAIVDANLHIVDIAVSQFKRYFDSYDDLHQVGCIGLLKAIERFDLKFGFKFCTYATPVIVGEMKRYLRDLYHTIRKPRDVWEVSYKVQGFVDRFVSLQERHPTIKEISEGLDIGESKIANALISIYDIISLDKPIGEDNENSGYSVIENNDPCFDNSDTWIDNVLLEEWLNRLSKEDLALIRQRYFEEKTQKEIARESGTNQMTISRRERKIINQAKVYAKR